MVIAISHLPNRVLQLPVWGFVYRIKYCTLQLSSNFCAVVLLGFQLLIRHCFCRQPQSLWRPRKRRQFLLQQRQLPGSRRWSWNLEIKWELYSTGYGVTAYDSHKCAHHFMGPHFLILHDRFGDWRDDIFNKRSSPLKKGKFFVT